MQLRRRIGDVTYPPLTSPTERATGVVSILSTARTRRFKPLVVAQTNLKILPCVTATNLNGMFSAGL